MKCVVCKGPAIIDIRRHNANFCTDHFLEQCRRQVTKAIDEYDNPVLGHYYLLELNR